MLHTYLQKLLFSDHARQTTTLSHYTVPSCLGIQETIMSLSLRFAKIQRKINELLMHVVLLEVFCCCLVFHFQFVNVIL